MSSEKSNYLEKNQTGNLIENQMPSKNMLSSGIKLGPQYYTGDLTDSDPGSESLFREHSP